MTALLRKSGDLPRRSVWQRIKDVALADVTVLARGGVKAGSLDDIEEILLEADFGVPVTLRLVEEVKRLALRGTVKTEVEFLAALRASVAASLRAGSSDTALAVASEAPTVIVVIGVNGAGKTTFIGKLAARLRREGRSVLLAAPTPSAPVRSTSSASGRSAWAPTSSADSPAVIPRPWRSMP